MTTAIKNAKSGVKILPTFEVDKEGLRKVLARKGAAWMLLELLQNTWDEDATNVEATLAWEQKPSGKNPGKVVITVEDDDPDGFTDIAHAYTLFAESEKKVDANKRGRFNVGEKLVIAACDRAVVSTTSGRVEFGPEGRIMLPAEREHGTCFTGYTTMTQKEFNEALALTKILLVPEDVTTTINGEKLESRKPLRSFKETLRTPIGPELRPSSRRTTVSLYEVREGETAYLYEMGIPVVPLIEGGDRWHIDIGQKVPLNIDRDNVTPAYLQDVRTAVANNAYDLIDEEDATQRWTLDAMADEKVTPEALSSILERRYGGQIAAFSPRDQEANKIATSQGYTVLGGGTFSKDVWTNLRKHNLIPSTADVTPSPKPYEPGQENERKTDPEEKWSAGQHRLARFVREVGASICDADVKVEFVNDPEFLNFAATYRRSGASGRMEFNVRTLGRHWFDVPIGEKQISIVLHELGHHMESDHLSDNYYRSLTDLGARLALEIAADPAWWAEITPREAV